MDSATFDKIICKVKELTGNNYAFKDLQLVSYDENTHHVVIQARDFITTEYVKLNCTNEIIEAFDSVLGVETTVSCTYVNPVRKEPHERFVM